MRTTTIQTHRQKKPQKHLTLTDEENSRYLVKILFVTRRPFTNQTKRSRFLKFELRRVDVMSVTLSGVGVCTYSGVSQNVTC